MFFTRSNKYQLSKATVDCTLKQETVDISLGIAIFATRELD